MRALVTDYQAVLDLFDRAFQVYKRIDLVDVTAGSLTLSEDWFDPNLSIQVVRAGKFLGNVHMLPVWESHVS